MTDAQKSAIAQALLNSVTDFVMNASAICERSGFSLKDAQEIEVGLSLAKGVSGGTVGLAQRFAGPISDIDKAMATDKSAFVKLVQSGQLPFRPETPEVEKLVRVLPTCITEDNAETLHQCYRNIYRLSKGLMRLMA